MKKILILTKGLQASASRDRALIYSNCLEKDNIIFKHFGLSKKPLNYIKALINAPFHDVVFLQRKLLPRIYFIFLRLVSKKIIYDFDDAVFLDSKGDISKNKFTRFTFICKKADLIFAGNDFLKSYSDKINKKTFIVPTCLDTKKYKIKFNNSKKFFDLVWVGQKSTSKYLIEIIPYLEKANEKFKDLRLINISNIILNSNLIQIKNIAWSESGQYKEIKSAKVGLAPLDTSNWSKGKCAFKVLQYASAGIPVISSNVGLNSKLINDYNIGLLVNNYSDWIKNIEKLRSDEKLRKVYAYNALKMSQNFDINSNYKNMKKIIKDVL
jgi:glycosyltransferase involved in cell wall biosynthesis